MAHYEFSKECIPNWALCYLINDDATGLTDEEIKMADEWCERNRISYVCTPEEDDNIDFEPYPAFGLACDCSLCYCYLQVED